MIFNQICCVISNLFIVVKKSSLKVNFSNLLLNKILFFLSTDLYLLYDVTLYGKNPVMSNFLN